MSKIDAKNRIGEKRIMSCGMQAEIIEYFGSKNITLQFEDGCIVKNKQYDHFKRGSVKHETNRLGVTRLMSCGMKATCVKYNKFNDIDIQFEDGTIAFNKNWGRFISGNITHPNSFLYSKERIGVTRLMNCGLSATCIAYRNSKDVDIQFEDGFVLFNKEWRRFIHGSLTRPNYSLDIKERIGSTYTMNCGMKATVIAYQSSKDIDVKFEDGTIVYNKMWKNFKKGCIANPNIIKHFKQKNTRDFAKERVGCQNMMNCGMKATVITYRSNKDIDVKFEDGTIVTQKNFRAFLKGNISNPTIKKQKNRKVDKVKILSLKKDERLNQTALMNCGLSATIIKYNKANDIDVQFDNGIIVSNRRYKDFINGNITYKEKKKMCYRRSTLKINRIGEKRMMNCGMKATIIKYINNEDLTVQFEDGFISEHIRYQCFARGSVYNPNIYGTVGISRNEYALQMFLKDYGFDKAQSGQLSKIGLGNLELDLYNPNLNGHKVAIEYDGGFLYKNRGHIKSRDIIKNKKCHNAGITLIRIREPQLPDLNDTSIDFKLTSTEVLSKNFISTINNIIQFLNVEYGSNINLICSFDKNAILEDFRKEHCGTLKNNPYKKIYNRETFENVRLSEINKMNCGMNAMIIGYRNRNDIDIEFEDGALREHVRYSSFKKGQIAHPLKKKVS